MVRNGSSTLTVGSVPTLTKYIGYLYIPGQRWIIQSYLMNMSKKSPALIQSRLLGQVDIPEVGWQYLSGDAHSDDSSLNIKAQ